MKKNIEIVPNIQKLFGTRDENLQIMEDGLKVTIDLKPDSVQIEGAAREVARAEQIFTDFEQLNRTGQDFSPNDLNSMLRVVAGDASTTLRGLAEAGKQRQFGKRQVQPKSMNQRRYLDAIEKYDMVFGIGPAGTGKTYLAVAMAVPRSTTRNAAASSWRDPRWKPVSVLAFCLEHCRRRLIPIFVRCMTLSMT